MYPMFLVRISETAEGNNQTTTYLRTFEISLETSEVSEETIQQEVVVSRGETSVDQNCWIDGRGQRIVRELIGYIRQGLESELPPNTMRTGVHPHDVLEASRRDLNIVIGISPASEPTFLIVIEHCRMLGVKCI